MHTRRLPTYQPREKTSYHIDKSHARRNPKRTLTLFSFIKLLFFLAFLCSFILYISKKTSHVQIVADYSERPTDRYFRTNNPSENLVVDISPYPRLRPPFPNPGCVTEFNPDKNENLPSLTECWASIYYDYVLQSSFSLDVEGHVTVSGNFGANLWWYKLNGTLSVFDHEGVTFGSLHNLVPQISHNGALSFISESSDVAHLVSDMDGFFFPESIYDIWLSSVDDFGEHGEWTRIFFDSDCSFRGSLLPTAIGRLHNCKGGYRSPNLTVELFKLNGTSDIHHLWTADHGVEWWEDPPVSSPMGARPALFMRLTSALVDQGISAFPLSLSVIPYVEALCKDGGVALQLDSVSKNKLDPRSFTSNSAPDIISVFSPQLDWKDDINPTRYKFIIVITTALTNPKTETHRLKCKIGDSWMKAWWVSWSIVLCATGSLHEKNTNPMDLSIWFDEAIIAKNGKVDVGFASRPRHKSLWMTQQGLHMNGMTWDCHVISICTMIKDEAPYLDEWIAYHSHLGVEQFYLYDNGPGSQVDVETYEVLEPWVRRGLITVVSWPHAAAQTQALGDCLMRYRHTTRWMTFVDVDEFMDPTPLQPIERPRQLEDLLAILEPDGLNSGPDTHCMPWVAYCQSGQLTPPEGGVLAAYSQISPVPASVKQRIHMQKPIFRANTALSLRAIGPHFLLYGTSDPVIQGSKNLKCPHKWEDPNVFRLRHYRSKSRDEYVKRRQGPDAAYRGRKHTTVELESEWEEENAHCVTENDSVG